MYARKIGSVSFKNASHSKHLQIMNLINIYKENFGIKKRTMVDMT